VNFGDSRIAKRKVKTMTTQHTKGPWSAQGDTYVTVNSLIIAHCKQAGNTTLEEAQANTRLIAAAPELLEALEQALGMMESVRDANVGHGLGLLIAIKNTKAAIAKARGQ